MVVYRGALCRTPSALHTVPKRFSTIRAGRPCHPRAASADGLALITGCPGARAAARVSSRLIGSALPFRKFIIQIPGVSLVDAIDRPLRRCRQRRSPRRCRTSRPFGLAGFDLLAVFTGEPRGINDQHRSFLSITGTGHRWLEAAALAGLSASRGFRLTVLMGRAVVLIPGSCPSPDARKRAPARCGGEFCLRRQQTR
jgi:hypothetical protein